MTCQDCIHYTDNKCEVWERPNPRIMCDHFDNNDGSYHDGHWHCHRCGKIVEVAGLCYECEQVYLTHNGVGNALDALKTIPKGGQIKPHMLHGWVYDDSWESVSK